MGRLIQYELMTSLGVLFEVRDSSWNSERWSEVRDSSSGLPFRSFERPEKNDQPIKTWDLPWAGSAHVVFGWIWIPHSNHSMLEKTHCAHEIRFQDISTTT